MDDRESLPFRPVFAAYLARMPRHEVQFIAEVAIDRLDALDGDPDLEATDAEDDFAEWPERPWHGPGCAISDPGGCEYDGREPEDCQ